MTQEKGEQRYFPKPEELAILVPKLKEYFQLRERSNERKEVVNKTYELVKNLNPEHWTVGKVRLWFNNNKSVYLGKDQRRVPTPIIKADKLVDPNANIEIEKNTTPGEYSVDTPMQIESMPSNEGVVAPTNIATPIDQPLIKINNAYIEPNPVHEVKPFTETKPFTDVSPIADPSTSITLPFSNNPFSPTNSSSLQPIMSPFDSKFSPTPSFGLPPLSNSLFNDPEQQLIHQQEPEPEKEISLPEIPDTDTDLDNQKYRLYESIKTMYKAVIDIGDLDPKSRAENQKKLEERMSIIFKNAHEIQNIPNICSNDRYCTRISISSSNSIQRQYSRTTESYANDIQNLSNVKYTETSQHVYIQSNFSKKLKEKVPRKLELTLRGEYKDVNIHESKGIIACSAFSLLGDVAYVYLDEKEHAYMLHFKDMEVPTGFYAKASSIFVDDNGSRIFVAGDCRIKSYSMGDLSLIENFQVSNPNSIIISSCLTVFNQSQESILVFGSNGSILMWDVSYPRQAQQAQIRNKDIALTQSLELKHIDWSKGRPSDSSFALEECMKEVTSLCPLRDYIAIASKKHHAIHLFDKDKKEIAGRLIGHVEGVTRLHRIDGKTLISSSKDYTLKIWNVEQMIPTHHLIRHSAKITSISSGTYENDLLVFSGAKDGIIIGWDINRKMPIFQIKLYEFFEEGAKCVPKELKFIPSKSRLSIVLERKVLSFNFKTE